MNINKKGFANIILVVVIVILVGTVGYFAFIKKSEPVIQQPLPIPIQVTNTTKPNPSKAPVAVSTFNVFFFNRRLSSTEDFLTADPLPVVRTVPHTTAIVTAAINELLKGPTTQEQSQGYQTNIPNKAKLLSLKIEDGIAYADFNGQTQSGGSSNPQTLLIEKTLLQFPTVKKVILSVEGKTEDIFQP